MKHLKTALIPLFALACCLLACRSSRPVVTGITYQDTTISSVRTVERDTTLKAPAASTSLSLSARDFARDLLNGSFQGATSQNKQAGLTLTQKGDALQVNCNCDTLAIAAKLRDTYTDQRRQLTITKTDTVEKRFVPWYVKILSWVGVAAIVVKLAGFGLKYFKLKS